MYLNKYSFAPSMLKVFRVAALMDIEKIKILRQRMSIPLNRAIELLRSNDGNLIACEQEFHSSNVADVVRMTECDEETARKNYEICNYDTAKTIDRINARQLIITTRKLRIPRNEIGFILWPEDLYGKGYKTTKRNDVFIPTDDFDYIIACFRSVFPLQNPWNKNTEKIFDIYGFNSFSNKTCRQIIKRINKIDTDNQDVASFLQEVIQWFNEKLNYADYIIVYGNL